MALFMKKDTFLISEKRPIAEDRYKRKVPVRITNDKKIRIKILRTPPLSFMIRACSCLNDSLFFAWSPMNSSSPISKIFPHLYKKAVKTSL